MPTLNTVNVGTNAALIYGSQGGNATPITVINLDTQNTVYVGNISNVLPGTPGAFPLAPLASISFDGSVSIYAVTLAATIVIGVVPGGNSFSPGSLNISGPVTATIAGPVTVNGSVNANITNASLAVTGNVGITGTPNVTISGTPNVNVSSGTLNANVTNGTINVGGSVSLIPSIAVLFSSSTNQNITGTSNINPVALADVSTYESYDMTMSVNDASQATAGHAYAFQVSMQWFDDLVSGIPVFVEDWYPWVGDTANATLLRASGPHHGHYLSIFIFNRTAGTITVNSMSVFGSPRNVQLSDWRQSPNSGVLSGGSNYHIIPSFSVGTDNMLADTGGFVTLAANTNYMLPLNLYSGPTDWGLSFGANIVVSRSNICNIGSNAANQTSGNLNSNANVLEVLGTAAGTQYAGSQLLPRAACGYFVGIGATGGTMQFTMVAQQGP
jgi:hypothetical protein